MTSPAKALGDVQKANEIKHILTVHGVVFAVFFLRRPAIPLYSLTTAIRSGAAVTTGDPQ